MAVWDVLRNLPPPPPRKTAPLKKEESTGEGNKKDKKDICRSLEGLKIIPVKLELDTAGKVQVKANSLRIPILRFVAEHEAELAQVLADMPGRKWDSMADSVEELITRVQNAG